MYEYVSHIITMPQKIRPSAIECAGTSSNNDSHAELKRAARDCDFSPLRASFAFVVSFEASVSELSAVGFLRRFLLIGCCF